MIVRANRPSVSLKTGRVAPLNGPFITHGRRPPGGWSVKLRLNGVDHVINGGQPGEVAKRMSEFATMNGEKLSPADIWLNLNLQWISRTEARYATVTSAELASAILDTGEKKVDSLRRGFTPDAWGSIAWKWLGLYLAQDFYSPDKFLHQMLEVLEMLNPSVCPTLGCVICYTEFSSEIQSVRQRMPQTREDARRYLWGFHNKVNARLGKRQVTFEQASGYNFWA